MNKFYNKTNLLRQSWCVLLLLGMFASFAVQAQTTMVEYDVANANAGTSTMINVLSTDAEVSATPLNSTVTVNPLDFASTFCFQGHPVTTIDPNLYYAFTITPDPGRAIDYANLDIAVATGVGGTYVFEIHASTDGFVGSDMTLISQNYTGGGTWQPYLNQDISALGTQAGPIEFRFYIVSGNSGSYAGIGTNAIFNSNGSNIIVRGTVENAAPPPATVPTLGQWGIILFTLLLLTLSVVTLVQRQTTTASVSGNASLNPRQLPFNRGLFMRLLAGVLMTAFVVFGAAIAMFGYELTSADVPGTLVCAPILAYLMSLAWVKK